MTVVPVCVVVLVTSDFSSRYRDSTVYLDQRIKYLSCLYCSMVKRPQQLDPYESVIYIYIYRFLQGPLMFTTLGESAHVSTGPDDRFEEVWCGGSDEVEELNMFSRQRKLLLSLYHLSHAQNELCDGPCPHVLLARPAWVAWTDLGPVYCT